MLFCPIRIGVERFPKEIALLTAEGALSYEALDRLVDSCRIEVPIFYARPDLKTVVQLFACQRRGVAVMPVSPRVPTLPEEQLPEEFFFCLQTSGSTGKPKVALLKGEHLYYNALGSPIALEPGDQWLASLPLNHVGGLGILFRCFMHGATVVLPDSKAMQEEITHLSFVPTQLKRYLKEPCYPKIKAMLLGGAPIPLTLATEAYHAGLPLYLTYGMTEMGSQVATRRFHPDEGLIFGPALPYRKLAIAPDGEILAGGEPLFSGYLGEDKSDCWFQTKDLGELTAKGLRLLGRKDRMRISGGENIYPEEIEAALTSIPEVERCLVSFREDLEFGHRPVVHIECPQEISFVELREKLCTLLPRYKVPDINDMQPFKDLQNNSIAVGAKSFL